jgi:hypothetical protein
MILFFETAEISSRGVGGEGSSQGGQAGRNMSLVVHARKA